VSFWWGMGYGERSVNSSNIVTKSKSKRWRREGLIAKEKRCEFQNCSTYHELFYPSSLHHLDEPLKHSRVRFEERMTHRPARGWKLSRYAMRSIVLLRKEEHLDVQRDRHFCLAGVGLWRSIMSVISSINLEKIILKLGDRMNLIVPLRVRLENIQRTARSAICPLFVAFIDYHNFAFLAWAWFTRWTHSSLQRCVEFWKLLGKV
jgi:hypothetical protein